MCWFIDVSTDSGNREIESGTRIWKYKSPKKDLTEYVFFNSSTHPSQLNRERHCLSVYLPMSKRAWFGLWWINLKKSQFDFSRNRISIEEQGCSNCLYSCEKLDYEFLTPSLVLLALQTSIWPWFKSTSLTTQELQEHHATRLLTSLYLCMFSGILLKLCSPLTYYFFLLFPKIYWKNKK